jgi:hypothetical protein
LHLREPNGGQCAALGGSGSFDVSAGGGCTWTAVPDPTKPWITIIGPASGSGSNTVSYSVASNAGNPSVRTGTIDVHGQIYSITQFGSSCSFTINPTSISATSAGGTALVDITASGAGCAWTAAATAGPVQLGVALPASGSGSGSQMVTVPANPDAGSRVLTATIAGHVLIVNQAG